MSKDEVILDILMKYNIIIQFNDDEGYKYYKKKHTIINNPTFKQWKEALFSGNNIDISVYGVFKPAQNNRLNALIKASSAENMAILIEQQTKQIKSKVKANSKLKINQIEENFKLEKNTYIKLKEDFYAETLIEIVNQLEGEGIYIEPTVNDFLTKYANENPKSDIYEILHRIIKAYNFNVSQFRKSLHQP